MIRTGTQVRFLASAESAQLLNVGDRRGALLPAWRASGGKVLLAELGDARLEELLRGGDPVLDATEWAKVQREVAAVRARGYALNIEGTEEGVSALGACVRNGAGDAVGTLTIAVPSARFAPPRREDLVRALFDTLAHVRPEIASFSG